MATACCQKECSQAGPNTIKGKFVVIGGGAKNLGGLIARDLAQNGAAGIAIHYNSDSSQADAEKTVAAVKALGANAFAFQADLTKVANVTKLFDETLKQFGKIDIAINTTGLVIKKPLVDVTEDDYDQSFAINSKAAFFFIQEAGKKLADRGKIVTIVSSLLAAYTGLYSIYPGSKAPIEHYTRAASKEFGARG
jgi:NAD(P)-dependent dehydrogenase (short-subunit alcohol dehydrogenase family)